jgi:hypothetical protein
MAPEISANLTAGRANPAPREAAIKAKRAVAERKAAAEAQKIVAIWNARRAGGRQGLVVLWSDALSAASYQRARIFRLPMSVIT